MATQYGDPTDFKLFGLPADALVNVSDAVLNRILTLNSGLIDSHLRDNYKLPLVEPYPSEILRAVYALTAYDVLLWRGFHPDSIDSDFKTRRDETMAWLKDLASGKVSLAQSADADGDYDGGPEVVFEGSSRVNHKPDGLARGW